MIIEMLFCLFLHKNTCCWCSLEAPWRGAPNEYPEHMLLWRNDKKFAFDELQIHDLAFFFLLEYGYFGKVACALDKD